MARAKRRRKSRYGRGLELQKAGKARHLGGGRYRIGSLRGDKWFNTLWTQGEARRGCDCSDPCMVPYANFWDHCQHVYAAMVDRDAALEAAGTTEERARVMSERGDVAVLGDGVRVEDLRIRHRLPLDLSRCTFWAGEKGSSADCEEWEATGGECAHVLAARTQLSAREVATAKQ